ncbi:MAG TPA: Gfo/Idh/MocA family oxidoreductase [Pirellulaceae bacterium]|nr:Gfo/Idh/MocA family oxidoreductase [Pirellulaceae bacterium]
MASAAPFRVAFLGIDHPHGSGWRESIFQLGGELEIAAIVPRFGGATTSLEERIALLPRFETLEELVRWRQFDGAIVCLPNNESPQAIAALAAAGKHIVAEKPAAASAADFAPALAAVEKAGVAFQSGYLWRYDPCAERLREMVADGRFGKLISVEMTFVTSDIRRRGPEHYLFNPALSGRGYFNWLGCHWLDLLSFITTQKVSGVTARVGTFGNVETGLEDGGAAIFDLAGGGMATFVGRYWLPRWTGESHWTLRGSERWVHWHPGRADTGGVLEIHGPQAQFMAMEEVFTQPPDPTPGYGGQRMLRLLRDWIADARSGSRHCRNTARQAMLTLELLDAIYRASAEGRHLDCAIG